MRRRNFVCVCGLSAFIVGCTDILDQSVGVRYELYIEDQTEADDLYEFTAENTSEEEFEILNRAIEEEYYSEGWSGNESRQRAFSESFNSTIDIIEQYREEGDPYQDGIIYELSADIRREVYEIELVRECGNGC